MKQPHDVHISDTAARSCIKLLDQLQASVNLILDIQSTGHAKYGDSTNQFIETATQTAWLQLRRLFQIISLEPGLAWILFRDCHIAVGVVDPDIAAITLEEDTTARIIYTFSTRGNLIVGYCSDAKNVDFGLWETYSVDTIADDITRDPYGQSRPDFGIHCDMRNAESYQDIVDCYYGRHARALKVLVDTLREIMNNNFWYDYS